MLNSVSSDTNLHRDAQNHRIECCYKKDEKVVSSTRIRKEEWISR